jgi:hypothetical protein
MFLWKQRQSSIAYFACCGRIIMRLLLSLVSFVVPLARCCFPCGAFAASVKHLARCCLHSSEFKVTSRVNCPRYCESLAMTKPKMLFGISTCLFHVRMCGLLLYIECVCVPVIAKFLIMCRQNHSHVSDRISSYHIRSYRFPSHLMI